MLYVYVMVVLNVVALSIRLGKIRGRTLLKSLSSDFRKSNKTFFLDILLINPKYEKLFINGKNCHDVSHN